MKKFRILAAFAVVVAGGLAAFFILRREQPVAASRFVEPDKLFEIIEANVRSQAEFEVIVDIDHARLAAKAGSPMPPAHVLIWSDPALDAAILAHNPLAAVDLPLRVLAYEDPETGRAAVIANGYEFVARRHSLPDDDAIRSRYEAAIKKAMMGIPGDVVGAFTSDSMGDSGLVTLDSPHDFETTEARVMGAIQSQPDTVSFGAVDFSTRSEKQGIDLRPTKLILFGGPGPGGRAMASAPTLGLDAFCQKLLIWQDEEGAVHVTFNDLVALAERQDVPVAMALHVINKRLQKTFSEALGS